MQSIISVTNARKNLFKLVKQVAQSGESVVIVQDSTPIVTITPYQNNAPNISANSGVKDAPLGYYQSGQTPRVANRPSNSLLGLAGFLKGKKAISKREQRALIQKMVVEKYEQKLHENS